MESIALKASLRKETGKKSSKAIRTQESIPCVLYGGKENVNIFVSEGDFRGLLYTPMVYVVNLDIEGNTHDAIIKDMQFHPVTDRLLHVDFYEVDDNKPVTINIPIKVVGSSVGVREGGKLVIEKRKILVKGLTKNIPAELEIDVTQLGIGKSVRAGDMETAGKFDIMLAKDIPVLSVRSTRASAAAASVEAAK